MMAFAAPVVSAANRLAVEWLAVQPGDPDPSTGHGPEWGKAAPAGLLIWLFMGAALFFLIKSMNKHMKKLPKSFAGSADAAPASAGGAAAADASSSAPEAPVGDVVDTAVGVTSPSGEADPGN